MALQTSGQISLNDLHLEVDGTSGSQVSLNDADIRDMIDKSSGAQSSISEYYGATSGNAVRGGHLFTQDPTGNYKDSFGSNKTDDPDPTSYTFTVPADVINISVVCIGRGAKENTSHAKDGVGGHGGGGLAYKNDIDVVAGQTFTVEMNDSHSRFYRSGVCDVKGNAGVGINGGSYSGGDGGGSGGNGGSRTYSGTLYVGAGSGGAGGYDGSGGTGGAGSGLYASAGSAGSNGAAGGGGNMWTNVANSGYAGGMYGGGTAPYGRGSNGSGGAGDTDSEHGANGSAGGVGSSNTTNFPSVSETQEDIFFGAGYKGGYAPSTRVARTTMAGCVRVVWGLGSAQAFPTTDVMYRDGESIN